MFCALRWNECASEGEREAGTHGRADAAALALSVTAAPDADAAARVLAEAALCGRFAERVIELGVPSKAARSEVNSIVRCTRGCDDIVELCRSVRRAELFRIGRFEFWLNFGRPVGRRRWAAVWSVYKERLSATQLSVHVKSTALANSKSLELILIGFILF